MQMDAIAELRLSNVRYVLAPRFCREPLRTRKQLHHEACRQKGSLLSAVLSLPRIVRLVLDGRERFLQEQRTDFRAQNTWPAFAEWFCEYLQFLHEWRASLYQIHLARKSPNVQAVRAAEGGSEPAQS